MDSITIHSIDNRRRDSRRDGTEFVRGNIMCNYHNHDCDSVSDKAFVFELFGAVAIICIGATVLIGLCMAVASAI